jgi:NIMA (never in mitosis gene a)-related kinase
MIKFEDIEDNEETEALEEFKLLLLRLLRYVSSLERNRKIFKQIFPNELLMPFIDVGHFVKPLKNYTSVL